MASSGFKHVGLRTAELAGSFCGCFLGGVWVSGSAA